MLQYEYMNDRPYIPMKCRFTLFVCIITLLLLAACTPIAIPGTAAAPTPSLEPLPTARVVREPTNPPAPTHTPRPAATATVVPSPTPIPTPSATPIQLTPTMTLTPLGEARRMELFEEVWRLVRDRYVYPDFRGLDWDAIRAEFEPQVRAAEDPTVFYALIQTMIDRLGDEHSRFDTPQEVAEEEARYSNTFQYGGIGALVRTVDEGGLIIQLAENGPAEQAGIQPRDVIVAVNGIPFTDTTAFGPDGPIGVVRGPAGTSVTLTVQSPGQLPRDLTIIRQIIPENAYSEVEGFRIPGTDVGLVRIGTFNQAELDIQVRERINVLLNAGPLDGLILDVRENSGGRLDLLMRTLSLFLNGGTIGRTESRTEVFEQRVPSGQTLDGLRNVPIVVLTSDGTASAAEMFAGGLQARGRAKIVGVPSAGNTENLLGHTLSDNSRLWLAERVYRLPDGGLIEGRGVQPDRIIEAEWWRYEPADDPQIQAAIEIMRTQSSQ